jgi:transcriptional regulator with XRE-family HTH domain
MVGVRRTSDPEIDEQVRIFGENMRVARLRAGLSQVGLAQASRLDRAAVSFLERAQRSPDLRTLVRVAGAVGLAPAELLAGIGASRTRRPEREPTGSSRAEGEGQFGENLRSARRQAGLSQEALAYEARVDRAAISVFERGHREPNLRTVLKLARALQLTPAELLRGVSRDVQTA